MKTPRLLQTLSIIAVLFGALTLLSGGRALFGDEQTRAAAGNVVGFVLWFNFIAGFAYVASGVGLWRARPWARWASALLALATAMIIAAFGWHVLGGGAYESRTVGALALRLAFWLLVAIATHRAVSARPPH